jgi:ABC-type multidrug transport system fused ATPase/permease subunit
MRFFLPALESLHTDLTKHPIPNGREVERVARSHQPIVYQRAIELDQIEYTYPGGEAPVLRDISIEIPRNTSVAFVGSTGCGKTTLVDILLGLLQPDQGVIRVDGIPVSSGNLAQWQKRLGYVPQHMYLSDDTVTNNIAFGVPPAEIDQAAVERAARIADLHDFIVSLPGGYTTIVGERGVRLSGGQRQRIGIARALYHDPDVLIMDEATSALDGITEETVIQAIRDLARQKTIILVAHRLTTVRACDAIYLFDRGEIVASGTYEDLMQSNLRFRAMARGTLDQAAAG